MLSVLTTYSWRNRFLHQIIVIVDLIFLRTHRCVVHLAPNWMNWNGCRNRPQCPCFQMPTKMTMPCFQRACSWFRFFKTCAWRCVFPCGYYAWMMCVMPASLRGSKNWNEWMNVWCHQQHPFVCDPHGVKSPTDNHMSWQVEIYGLEHKSVCFGMTCKWCVDDCMRASAQGWLHRKRQRWTPTHATGEGANCAARLREMVVKMIWTLSANHDTSMKTIKHITHTLTTLQMKTQINTLHTSIDN